MKTEMSRFKDGQKENPLNVGAPRFGAFFIFFNQELYELNTRYDRIAENRLSIGRN